MYKTLVMRGLVFLYIIAILIVAYGLYFTLGLDLYLFGVHDGGADIETWLDSNGNGVKDPGELPLAGVCVWSGNLFYGDTADERNNLCGEASYYTNDKGLWNQFLPGGSCNEVLTFAKVPVGFQPTTDLGSTGCPAQFGFAPIGSLPKKPVLSPTEYAQHQIWLNRLKKISKIVVIVLMAVFISIKIIPPQI